MALPHVLERSTAHHHPRTVVKCAATNGERVALKREYSNYGISEIASCPSIRTLYDTVRPEEDPYDLPYLMFEWMDLELRSVPASRFQGDPRLPKAVSKAVLSALGLFNALNVVHTGNCSPINTSSAK
jgi:hypothetical protein